MTEMDKLVELLENDILHDCTNDIRNYIRLAIRLDKSFSDLEGMERVVRLGPERFYDVTSKRPHIINGYTLKYGEVYSQSLLVKMLANDKEIGDDSKFF
ncbi:hypothetical protein [Streptococcus gallolyticus]|uniref:hypothetical protein n=1 Tax=Streptococcus gallolyticus TaxID=315405 RepID=UPI0022853A96|nr:hypothetical protein [Streptococcus gallolyticus]MCY7179660.1 hypothetical protein [Streptococcus gallolyticus subsp. gallolyticus]MCY7195027.1 hypothetical protein [Streptococcus gallolyticus subsp. gallolyticus]